ncbi:XRE family transcriptional regulator [Paenibacillus sp. 1011MAR3C5]|uniref:helix-turn-helix transcriptional regulator n=1 Tax=Paenibacillus sp. 1011MAR3C5 TaxID=1675787 RepID=UPI000E6D4784|nr:XRE family transcriptional regulator [Paenibacillus sp. 1011MAR3C5]
MAFLLGECLLRERLEDAKMTQAEFARRMECSPQYVSGLISGKERMSLEFAINSSFVLKCRVTDLHILVPARSRKG